MKDRSGMSQLVTRSSSLHIYIFPQESLFSQELVQTENEGLVELVEDFYGLWQHGAHFVVAAAHVDGPVPHHQLHRLLSQWRCHTRRRDICTAAACHVDSTNDITQLTLTVALSHNKRHMHSGGLPCGASVLTALTPHSSHSSVCFYFWPTRCTGR